MTQEEELPTGRFRLGLPHLMLPGSISGVKGPMWFGRISVALEHMEHMECLCSRSFDTCPDVEASQVFVPTTIRD